jgi:hypothetical protein
MNQDQPAKPRINFHCTRQRGGCGSRFATSEYDTHDYPERDWHPYNHVATCPKCGEFAEQAAHQLAAWKSAATPKTAEARAAISHGNKARDKASWEISRFNAITHGATAETAKYYPARPGHYDLCEHCEYLIDGCGTELRHCAKRTELFVQFSLAQESGDGSLLGKLMASTQAGLMAITADMIRSIARRGVELETPIFTKGENGIDIATYQDAEGKERTLMRIEAHPLLPHLINYIQKNTMTLGDMGLTPKVQEEQKQFRGFLDAKEADRETLQDASRTQHDLVANLLRVVGGVRVIEGGRVVDAEVDDAG